MTSARPHSLDGHWRADPANCIAIEKQLRNALETAQAKELRGATKHSGRKHGADLLEGGEMRNLPYGWELREQKEQYQALLAAVTPECDLTIVDEPGQFIITASNGARRTFEPGSYSTLVTTFAYLRIAAGWQNQEFVVHSKDSRAGVDIHERYREEPEGSLLLSVTLSVKFMETQHFSLVYRK